MSLVFLIVNRISLNKNKYDIVIAVGLYYDIKIIVNSFLIN